MVEWNGLYIAAEEFISIRCSSVNGKSSVDVVLKNGDKYHTEFSSYEDAKTAARLLACRVDGQTQDGRIQQEIRYLRNDISSLRSGVGLLDKRQRRFWQKLKLLLPGIGEDDAE